MEFLKHLEHSPEHFRQQIQHFLCKMWGYHHSVLWFTDESGNISHPHLYQIQDKVIFDYLANYDELDFLHPKKHLNNISEQTIFRISDIVPNAKFEKSEFYTGFMKKHHYHDEMVVNFTYQNKLVGTLGLLRSKGDRPFDKQDVKRFEAISTFISLKISSQIMLEKAEYQKRIFEAHADRSPHGLIILDLTFRPLYYNSSARDITSDLLANKSEKTIDIFVQKYLLSQSYVQLGFVRFVSSPSFQQYTIQFDPKSDFQKEPVYIVHLIPNTNNNTSTPTIDHTLSLLTPREMEICHLIRKGYTNLEIAEQSCISINTVKRHIQNIFSKLDVKNRTGLLSKIDFL
ncbi:LuxR C-terminal-related transcriptional regulator [Fictibacillus enclensis]|uniref:response regulator transcription factor n=1 Tax=Fictibacillus enclensis TaxID=1017270 RepID=UPI003D320169